MNPMQSPNTGVGRLLSSDTVSAQLESKVFQFEGFIFSVGINNRPIQLKENFTPYTQPSRGFKAAYSRFLKLSNEHQGVFCRN